MTLIGYVLWLVFSVYIGKRIARAVGWSRRAKLAAGWSAAVLLALLPFGDIVLGLPVTIDACRNRGGLQVHEDVSLPLTSVVETLTLSEQRMTCGDCNEILIRRLAREVQVDILGDEDGRGKSGLVSEAGPSRFWLSHRGDPYCDQYFATYAPTENVRRKIWSLAGVPYDDNVCIAAQSITEISADYDLTLERAKEERHGIARLKIREVALTRQSDAKRIASLARISQVTWLGLLGEGRDPSVPICPSAWGMSRDFSYLEFFNRLAKASSRKEQP